MSKLKSSPLLELISCLSKAEKRHFKLMARRNSNGCDSMFLLLFDHLDKTKSLDDEFILRKIPKIKKAQIANIKSNLYKQLLASLRLFHRCNNENIYLSEQLDYARVLYDKGLYKSSLDVLEKAKKLALQKKQFLIAQNMVEFEKHIESQHITGSMSDKADHLFDQSHFLINRNQKSAKLSSASLQLYGLYLKHGYVRNESDFNRVTHFFHQWMPDYDLNTLDFYEKMYFFQSHVWYSNMCHDFLNYYKYAQRWVNLFHEYPLMIIKETASYIKGLHNVLNALFLAGKYERFLNAYQELLEFNKNGQIQINRNEESLLVLFQNVHKINLHYMQGSFSEGVEEIPELERVLKLNTYNWDSHRIMVFYYKIACLYFGMGENEKAIHYLNLIINNYIPSVREDIQSFARILNLLAHFELGNKFLISYQIKSVYRFLLKMNDLHAVQKEILKFLRKTPAMKTEQLSTEFKKLKDTLILIQSSKFEKRPFLYLDIISWLESKLEGVIVEKVIAENFGKKQFKNIAAKEGINNNYTSSYK